MNRVKVEGSRNIREAGWAATSLGEDGEKVFGTMEVLFANGQIYRYRLVPFETWHNFMNSPSKGSFLAKEIMPLWNASPQVWRVVICEKCGHLNETKVTS